MKNYILILSLITLNVLATTAQTQYFFYVQLSDKNNSTYSLAQPEQYLSQRALNRRIDFGVGIDSTDLPINQSYVNQIVGQGVTAHSRSKWLNGITVRTADSSLMAQVRLLPFVKSAQYTGQINSASLPTPQKSKFTKTSEDYGTAEPQINMIKANALHNAGFTGKEMHIAVLDAGFKNVDVNIGFDSLRLQGRLLGTKDFAEPSSNIFALDEHGANVLSIMTGNLPNEYLGSAPHASYWLLRTEYGPSEYMMELDFWVSALEFADSVGADLVNSSLGYTTFDDISMNFSYSDMDGKTARASIAAGLASQKGIVVCNSAGNDGAKDWKYIGSPADAFGIFAIGANTITTTPSSFTSYGPSFDLRIKPEISGLGTATALINSAGKTVTGNGTSYSSPLLCGALACFLEYYKASSPNISMSDFIKSVLQNSSLYSTPSPRLGYGIPNFEQSMNQLTTNSQPKLNTEQAFTISQMQNGAVKIKSQLANQPFSVKIFDSSARLIIHLAKNKDEAIISSRKLTTGVYLVKIESEKNTYTNKLIIQ